jgi:hypothetical protein
MDALETVGALLVAIGMVLQGPLPGLTRRPVGPRGTLRARVSFALAAAGAAEVAVGSVQTLQQIGTAEPYSAARFVSGATFTASFVSMIAV